MPYSDLVRKALWVTCPLLLPALLAAQSSSGILRALPAPRLAITAGSSAVSKIGFRLTPGYHTNSNTPSDEYLIPLKLSWDASPLQLEGVDYPKGQLEKYAFSEKPLSVYTGNFDISSRFKAPASAPKGPHTIKGKLRFQACSETTCYPPKTIAVELAVQIQ